MSDITVGLCVALNPDARYGLFEDGGHAPFGHTIERIYDCGEGSCDAAVPRPSCSHAPTPERAS